MHQHASLQYLSQPPLPSTAEQLGKIKVEEYKARSCERSSPGLLVFELRNTQAIEPTTACASDSFRWFPPSACGFQFARDVTEHY